MASTQQIITTGAREESSFAPDAAQNVKEEEKDEDLPLKWQAEPGFIDKPQDLPKAQEVREGLKKIYNARLIFHERIRVIQATSEEEKKESAATQNQDPEDQNEIDVNKTIRSFYAFIKKIPMNNNEELNLVVNKIFKVMEEVDRPSEQNQQVSRAAGHEEEKKYLNDKDVDEILDAEDLTSDQIQAAKALESVWDKLQPQVKDDSGIEDGMGMAKQILYLYKDIRDYHEEIIQKKISMEAVQSKQIKELCQQHYYNWKDYATSKQKNQGLYDFEKCKRDEKFKKSEMQKLRDEFKNAAGAEELVDARLNLQQYKAFCDQMNKHNRSHDRWVHDEPKKKNGDPDPAFLESMYEVHTNHQWFQEEVDENGRVKQYLNGKNKIRKFQEGFTFRDYQRTMLPWIRKMTELKDNDNL